MSKELSRNSAIEAMRFFFMAVICVHHSHFLPAMRHGYLAVEFFFILSGVFIYRAFLRLDSPSPMEYTIGRIKKIWPKYFVALLLTMGALYQRAIEMFKNGRGWEYVMNVFNDVLMISSLGIYKGEVNSTLWYVVVLIFGGGILYALLKWNSRFTISIILPLSALFYYTYIFNEGDCVEYWGADGFIYHPLLRGVADMSIGIVCWHIFSRIKSRIPLLLTNIISMVSLFAIWTFFLPTFIMTGMFCYSFPRFYGDVSLKRVFCIYYSKVIFGDSLVV